MKKEFAVLQACLAAAAKTVRKNFGKVGYELKGKANLVLRQMLRAKRLFWH